MFVPLPRPEKDGRQERGRETGREETGAQLITHSRNEMNLPAPLICKTPSSTSQVAASPRSSSLVRPSACRPTCSSRERGPPRDRRSRARHASNRGIDSLRASPLSQASRFGHVPWASQPSRNSALFAGRHTQARYHSRPQDPPIAIARNGESDSSSPPQSCACDAHGT